MGSSVVVVPVVVLDVVVVGVVVVEVVVVEVVVDGVVLVVTSGVGITKSLSTLRHCPAV